MPDALSITAGDCTVVHDRDDRREYRGRVVVLTKRDNTVLVHAADGYQPVAWLTRADAVTHDADGLVARSDGETLRVTVHDRDGNARYPVTGAGRPVGDCPDCDDRLVRDRGRVACIGCTATYSLPADATVRDAICECGLPRLRVERGVALDVCLDRDCDPIDDAVADRFDRRWDCPDCEDDLRVLRRGGLMLGCDAYPDCEIGFSFPAGTVVDDCDCGLPVFETASGRGCLDSTCDAVAD